MTYAHPTYNTPKPFHVSKRRKDHGGKAEWDYALTMDIALERAGRQDGVSKRRVEAAEKQNRITL